MLFSNQELNIFESLGVSLSEDYHADLIYLEEIMLLQKILY